VASRRRPSLVMPSVRGKIKRNIDEVEYATARWADWLNHHRLYGHRGDIPQVETETH
jgi:hypothetical protein